MKMKHENHIRTTENQSRRSHENVERNFSFLISHNHQRWGGGGGGGGRGDNKASLGSWQQCEYFLNDQMKIRF